MRHRPAALAFAVLIATAGAPPLAADTITVSTVADWRAVFGTVQSVRRAEARVRIPGTLVELTVTEGDAVAAGQVIARVEDDKLALELAALDAGLRALDAQAAQAGIDLERAEELRARGAIPAAQLDQARTAADVVEQNRAARQAERAVLLARQDEGAVVAPEAGRVLSVPMVQGMAVQPGETVAIIATEDFVLRTRLPERHAAYVTEGEAVRIAGRAMLTGGDTIEGRIGKVYPELVAGEVVVDIAADGLGDFFVGERIRIEVATGRREAIVVAERFLDRRHGVTFARLEGAGEIVVQPGQAVDDGVEILAGLRPGDRLTAYRD